jgi:hypothetical protein
MAASSPSKKRSKGPPAPSVLLVFIHQQHNSPAAHSDGGCSGFDFNPPAPQQPRIPFESFKWGVLLTPTHQNHRNCAFQLKSFKIENPF